MMAASRYDWNGATKLLLPITNHFPWQPAQKIQAGFSFLIGQKAFGQPNLVFSDVSTWEFFSATSLRTGSAIWASLNRRTNYFSKSWALISFQSRYPSARPRS
jgi:hypothetical protein